MSEDHLGVPRGESSDGAPVKTKIEHVLVYLEKSIKKGSFGDPKAVVAGDFVTFYEDLHFTTREVEEVKFWGVHTLKLKNDAGEVIAPGPDVHWDKFYRVTHPTTVVMVETPVVVPQVLDIKPDVMEERPRKRAQAAPTAEATSGRDPRLPPAGTTLTRAAKGLEVRVLVQGDDFVWEGKTYKSLSKVAQEATGAKSINGFAFFKLTGPWTPTLDEVFGG